MEFFLWRVIKMKMRNKLILGLTASSIAGKLVENMNLKDNVTPNTQTTFNLEKDTPTINKSSYIHHFASIIGSVVIGKEVFVGPFSSIRGDEGLGIHIGEFTNVQDGVVIHGLKNYEYGNNLSANSVYIDQTPYSVYVGNQCSLAHQCQVHGPARIDSNVFIGMQSFVFDAYIKENAVLEPGSKVIGVTIPENRYVAAGKVITKQEEADQLPEINEEYRYYQFNEKVVLTNRELALQYKGDKK